MTRVQSQRGSHRPPSGLMERAAPSGPPGPRSRDPVNQHDHRATAGLTVGHPVTAEVQLADLKLVEALTAVLD